MSVGWPMGSWSGFCEPQVSETLRMTSKTTTHRIGKRRSFISCNATPRNPGIASTSSGGRNASAVPPAHLRVPTSKELDRIRQFRNQQTFKQQQVLRHQMLKTQGPSQTPSQVPWQRQGPPPNAVQKRKESLQKSPQPAKIQHTKKEKKKRATAPIVYNDGLSQDEFQELVTRCGLEAAWRPQVGLLMGLGLQPSDLSRLVVTRPEVFQTGVSTMRKKLNFLRDVVGLKEADLGKVVVKFPRILEYGLEQTVKPRLEFLNSLGINGDETAKVVLRAPMIMALSVKETLEPRARFLMEELHLPEGTLGKLITRHPQVLTCSEEMMYTRTSFLRNECGLSNKEIAKAVLAHPQVLHYKIASMQERIDYLQRSVGMTNEQIAAAVSRFPQIFSLAVSSNIAPKWRYLVEHLGGDVSALCTYPGYFSLSLSNRIVPRHRYLLHLKGDQAPLPFPLSILKLTDKKFAVEAAGKSLVEYEEFKEKLESDCDAENEGLTLAEITQNYNEEHLEYARNESTEEVQGGIGLDIEQNAWLLDSGRVRPCHPSLPSNLQTFYKQQRSNLNLGSNSPLVRRAGG